MMASAWSCPSQQSPSQFVTVTRQESRRDQDIATLIESDLKKTDIKHGYVYAARAYENFTKIGFSRTSVQDRLRSIEAKCKIKYDRWYASDLFQGARRAESIIHKCLVDRTTVGKPCKCKRTHREWFRVCYNTAHDKIQIVCTWFRDQQPYDFDTRKLKPLWREALQVFRESLTSENPMPLAVLLTSVQGRYRLLAPPAYRYPSLSPIESDPAIFKRSRRSASIFDTGSPARSIGRLSSASSPRRNRQLEDAMSVEKGTDSARLHGRGAVTDLGEDSDTQLDDDADVDSAHSADVLDPVTSDIETNCAPEDNIPNFSMANASIESWSEDVGSEANSVVLDEKHETEEIMQRMSDMRISSGKSEYKREQSSERSTTELSRNHGTTSDEYHAMTDGQSSAGAQCSMVSDETIPFVSQDLPPDDLRSESSYCPSDSDTDNDASSEAEAELVTDEQLGLDIHELRQELIELRAESEEAAFDIAYHPMQDTVPYPYLDSDGSDQSYRPSDSPGSGGEDSSSDEEELITDEQFNDELEELRRELHELEYEHEYNNSHHDTSYHHRVTNRHEVSGGTSHASTNSEGFANESGSEAEPVREDQSQDHIRAGEKEAEVVEKPVTNSSPTQTTSDDDVVELRAAIVDVLDTPNEEWAAACNLAFDTETRAGGSRSYTQAIARSSIISIAEIQPTDYESYPPTHTDVSKVKHQVVQSSPASDKRPRIPIANFVGRIDQSPSVPIQSFSIFHTPSQSRTTNRPNTITSTAPPTFASNLKFPMRPHSLKSTPKTTTTTPTPAQSHPFAFTFTPPPPLPPPSTPSNTTISHIATAPSTNDEGTVPQDQITMLTASLGAVTFNFTLNASFNSASSMSVGVPTNVQISRPSTPTPTPTPVPMPTHAASMPSRSELTGRPIFQFQGLSSLQD